jgi:hypothetical protein
MVGLLWTSAPDATAKSFAPTGVAAVGTAAGRLINQGEQ